jgi:hypothetical protein
MQSSLLNLKSITKKENLMNLNALEKASIIEGNLNQMLCLNLRHSLVS